MISCCQGSSGELTNGSDHLICCEVRIGRLEPSTNVLHTKWKVDGKTKWQEY